MANDIWNRLNEKHHGTGPGREQLRSLAASDLLSVNFSAYSAAMERDIGAVDLLRWASILNGTADQLQPYDAKAANILWNNSLYLEDLHASLLLPVRATSSRLGAAAAALEQRIRVNQSTPQQTIEQLVRMAERAQTVLRVNGTNQLREVLSFASTPSIPCPRKRVIPFSFFFKLIGFCFVL